MSPTLSTLCNNTKAFAVVGIDIQGLQVLLAPFRERQIYQKYYALTAIYVGNANIVETF